MADCFSLPPAGHITWRTQGGTLYRVGKDRTEWFIVYRDRFSDDWRRLPTSRYTSGAAAEEDLRAVALVSGWEAISHGQDPTGAW